MSIRVEDVARVGDGCGGKGGLRVPEVGLSALVYPVDVVLEPVGFVSPLLVHAFELELLE